MAPAWPLVACLIVGAASLVVPAAPGYDAWSWLIWGREVAALDLETAEGPAWKPLPVAVTSVLAVLAGDAAPELWLVLARAGAALAVVEAFRLARRLGGGSLAAGAVSAVGVLFLENWVWHAAVGNAEGILAALALAAVRHLLDGRLERAFWLAGAAALIRVEVWPFVTVLGLVVGTHVPATRLRLLAAALAVPTLWFLPDLLASGDALRSFERARVPNPGAPALAERPAWEALSRAAGLSLPALLVGAVGAAALGTGLSERSRAARRIAAPAALGVVWAATVAAMSEVGFSGEERYLLPAAVLVTVSGGPGLALVARRAVAGTARGRLAAALLLLTAALLTAPAASSRVGALGLQRERLAHADALSVNLGATVRILGSRERVEACGRPWVGRFRAPVLAWTLGVHKARVGLEPGASGVLFRSRLHPTAPLEPPVPAGFRRATGPASTTDGWEVWRACASNRPRS